MSDELAQVSAVRAPDGRVHLTIEGEIDGSNADALRHRIEDEIDGARSVAIDLGGVSYIDSQGLRLLLHVAQDLDGDPHGLTLVAPPGCFAAELLAITRIGDIVPVREELPLSLIHI